MSSTNAHFALRKWYALLKAPTFWAVVGAATLITMADDISLTAPIGTTLQQMFRRFAMIALSSTVASLSIVFGATSLDRRLAPIPKFGLAGLATSPFVFVVVVAIVTLSDRSVPEPAALLEILASVTVTVTAIALTIGVFERRDERGTITSRDDDDETRPSQFLRRLPDELGHDLVRISACDHYVEAHTRQGHALVLIRFADALDELGRADGLQIHRSHWVARTAVRGLVNAGRSLFVELDDGTRLPVSRSRRAAVRAEGFATHGCETKAPPSRLHT